MATNLRTIRSPPSNPIDWISRHSTAAGIQSGAAAAILSRRYSSNGTTIDSRGAAAGRNVGGSCAAKYFLTVLTEQPTSQAMARRLLPCLCNILICMYVRYDFGGTRLLCSKAFDPATVSVGAVKAARNHKAPDPRFIAGSGCVQTSSAELRSLRIPMEK